eukprot:6193566-Pleurochrysis_carterae.AAC.2
MRGALAATVASSAKWCQWLRMCKRGRCICSDIRQLAHALGRRTGQARTLQQCCVRHGELCRWSSSSLAARDDIRGDAMVLLADVLELSRVQWPHM